MGLPAIPKLVSILNVLIFFKYFFYSINYIKLNPRLGIFLFQFPRYILPRQFQVCSRVRAASNKNLDHDSLTFPPIKSAHSLSVRNKNLEVLKTEQNFGLHSPTPAQILLGALSLFLDLTTARIFKNSLIIQFVRVFPDYLIFSKS